MCFLRMIQKNLATGSTNRVWFQPIATSWACAALPLRVPLLPRNFATWREWQMLPGYAWHIWASASPLWLVHLQCFDLCFTETQPMTASWDFFFQLGCQKFLVTLWTLHFSMILDVSNTWTRCGAHIMSATTISWFVWFAKTDTWQWNSSAVCKCLCPCINVQSLSS